MTLFDCSCRKSCALFAVIASLVLGVIAAFLQITAVITAVPAFLWVALGIAVVYLGILQVTVALTHSAPCTACKRGNLGTVLAGILGTILISVIGLAVGLTATSVVSAILVGLLVAFLTLIFTGSACLVLCIADCDNE